MFVLVQQCILYTLFAIRSDKIGLIAEKYTCCMVCVIDVRVLLKFCLLYIEFLRNFCIILYDEVFIKILCSNLENFKIQVAM